jgi:DNA-binding NarL/FixJ family response regulator
LIENENPHFARGSNGTTITGCRSNGSRIFIERVFLRVLFLAKDLTHFSALIAGLQRQSKIELLPAKIGSAGLSLLKDRQIDVVIVDEQLGDMSGIAFVKQLVKISPLAHAAIVSALTAEEFHEATEGLGVLMQLPREPREKDAETLLATLEKIGALLQPVAPQPRKAAKP